MMRLKAYSFIVFALFCMLLLGACSTETSEENVGTQDVLGEEGASEENTGAGEVQEVKAKIAHVYPPELFISKGYEIFAEKVAEKSDNKIKFTIYPAGQLYTDVAAPNAVSSGQIEMGVNTLEMWSSNVAATEFTTLPIFTDADHLRRSMENGIYALLKEELNKFGAEPLLYAEFGFSYFASSDKPLVTPEDFKNKKIRTTAPLMSKFVELVGGSPVAISGGEVPEALQRGTIDAAVSGVAGFAASQYYQYTDYYTGPLNAGLVLLSANQKWWNGLNDTTQQVIVEAASETEQWIKEQQEIVFKESVEKIESEGMKSATFDVNVFADSVTELQTIYTNSSGELGEQIIQIIEENR